MKWVKINHQLFISISFLLQYVCTQINIRIVLDGKYQVLLLDSYLNNWDN